MDTEKQEVQTKKQGGGFFKLLIIVGALVIIAGVAISVIYMAKKSSGNKALDTERKLIKVNWQNKN